MVKAIWTSNPQPKLLQQILMELCKLKHQTRYLTEVAYEWCSVFCEKYFGLSDGHDLLFLSLEIGFRHCDPKSHIIKAKLSHTNHHLQMICIFSFGNSETVADLLYAWTSKSNSHEPYESLGVCAQYLVDLKRLQPFSSRDRKSVV